MPTSEHDFDFLHGHWRVEHHRLRERLNGCTEWERFDGTCTAWPVLGGQGNVDDNLLHLPGGSYRATTLRSHRPQTGRWSIWWLDGRQPHRLDVPVVGHFDQGVGTFFAEDALDGRPIRVRFRQLDDALSPSPGLRPTARKGQGAGDGGLGRPAAPGCPALGPGSRRVSLTGHRRAARPGAEPPELRGFARIQSPHEPIPRLLGPAPVVCGRFGASALARRACRRHPGGSGGPDSGGGGPGHGAPRHRRRTRAAGNSRL